MTPLRTRWWDWASDLIFGAVLVTVAIDSGPNAVGWVFVGLGVLLVFCAGAKFGASES